MAYLYGTGDMDEVGYLFTYRKNACMGGDNIPRRPPIWECSYCSARFRKINPDGTDAAVKVHLLKNERRGNIKIHMTYEDGHTETI